MTSKSLCLQGKFEIMEHNINVLLAVLATPRSSIPTKEGQLIG